MPIADEKKDKPNGKILILNERPLNSKHLLDYLRKRKFPLLIAERFCREIEFTLYGKKQGAIGFKNDAGGYELRNETFKGSSSPKVLPLLQIMLMTFLSLKSFLISFRGKFYYLRITNWKHNT